ncbi:MAG TPA: hypothetical protein VNA12_06955 [Mycobacteriales bacterium]|nr:hypothetical protein [Mycobacteriales bacterium]
MHARSPEISRREVLAYVLGGVLLALLMSWPLALHLGERIPQDVVDPLNQTWQLAWGGHALRTSPADLWQGNAFFPVEDSLAFSDSLLGYAPISVVFARGTAGALRAYNLAFIAAYAMCFAGAALLARELGLRASAAAVAGVAFAFAPWRMTHNGHLNILSVGGVALTLFLLLRGYRRESAPLIVAGWLTAAWQLSLGFAMGLFFAYLLMLLGALTVVALLLRRGPRLCRGVVVGTALGTLLFLAATVLLARPYLRITERYPEAERTIESVDFFSPPTRSLLAAAGESRVWGERTRTTREALPFAPEQALFPGVLVVVLAAAGLGARVLSVRWRIGLAVGLLVTAVLSLGTRLGTTRPLYVFLFDHAPGWNAVRTPGRIMAFASLALALLAAAGAHALQDAVLDRRGRHLAEPGRRRTAMPMALLATALSCVVFAEGMPRLPQPDVPARPAALDAVTVPRVHLPTDFAHDPAYMYFSVADFTAISNGSTSFVPPRLERLRQDLATFPDAASVASLRELGLRAVVLHLDRAPGTQWAETALRPIDGLGLTREQLGDLVVYRLTP